MTVEQLMDHLADLCSQGKIHPSWPVLLSYLDDYDRPFEDKLEKVIVGEGAVLLNDGRIR
jgi:hypothetical protein